MQIKTVGDIRKAIQDYPDDFKIICVNDFLKISILSRYKRDKGVRLAKKTGFKSFIKKVSIDF